MKADLSKSKARKTRRLEKVAENAHISCAVLHPSGICPGYPHKSPQDDPGRAWGVRDATFPINQPRARKSKPRKPKRKKSPSMSRLKALLWDQEREVVYMESPDRCMTCGSDSPPVACHICPAEEGAVIKFFLPAIYRGCRECNESERYHRGWWRGRFEERFGKDFVDALYLMAEEENRKPISEKFQNKKWWVIEQTERMNRLRGIA